MLEELAKWKKTNFISHWAAPIFKAAFGSYGGKKPLSKLLQSNASKVIGFAWKPLYTIKFRHELKLSVKPESPSMITAPERILDSISFHDNVPSVCADIGYAMNSVVSVASQNKWFV
jgi:hypothetical protein